MSTLRATASEFVPTFCQTQDQPKATKNDIHVSAQQLEQYCQTQIQQQEDLTQENCSHVEQQYGYEDGYYDENGDWIPYDSTDYVAEQQDWQADQEWPECSQQQQWTAYDQHTPWQAQQHQFVDDYQQSEPNQQPHQQEAWWQDDYSQQQQSGCEQDACCDTQAAQQPGEMVQQEPDWNDLGFKQGQAVQMLKSWYPQHSAAMLTQLLQACDGQMQDAIQLLSEMEHDEQQQQQQQSFESTSGAKYAAAAAGTVRSAANRNQHQQQSGFSLHDELFPDLAAAAAATATAVDYGGAIWGKAVNSATVQYDGSGSWSKVATKAAAAAAGQGSSNNNSRGRQGTAAISSNNTGPKQLASTAAAAADSAVPWVQTGAAVAKEYAAAREEARDYARIRNACFHQATIAYLAGDKALAKELSAKGKQAADQMFDAHERASQQIFTQRNAKLAAAVKPHASNSSSSTAVIDLHGLHVREVKSVLPQQLAALAQQKQHHVNLIVGTGHHTKGAPSARVGPAVEALLQELGYKYRQPQPGLLRVQLS